MTRDWVDWVKMIECWKLVSSLVLIIFLCNPHLCSGRRARQVDNMLDDFDIESQLPRFAQPIPNVTVTIGKDALLPCVVDNLRSYKVAWVRVDTQTILTIHQAVITRNPRITLSYSDHRSWFLQIKNTHEMDRGWYMCQINTDPMRSLMGYLEVVVPPQIIDQDTSTDIVAKEGSNVTLQCKAKGHPEPYVMWRREDNREIQYNGNLVNVIDGEVFPIIKISRLHMGAYLCIASNGIPPSISKRVEVKVQFPPMMTIPHQLEGAYMGQDVTLECQTEAHPKSINYWTTEKGDMIVSGDKFESFLVDTSYKMYMRLKIRNLTKNDFGTYKCVAKNSLGETDGNIKLYEIPAPSTTTTTTPRTTPLPKKDKIKKKSKVNEVVIETGYDEWSNNKGQPNYEDLQNNDMASSSSSGSISPSIPSPPLGLFLLAPLMNGGWEWMDSTSAHHHRHLVPNEDYCSEKEEEDKDVKKSKNLRLLSPLSTHILSSRSCSKNITKNYVSQQWQASPWGNKMKTVDVLHRKGFYSYCYYYYESGINLMCLSLILIMVHFH